MLNFSYWELKEWFSNVDITIVGSGIVGLSTALQLKKKYPTAKILVLEKGMLPQGASTKNAGFACFGSLSELIDDLQSHREAEVLDLVAKRWEGLKELRSTVGDLKLDFQQKKGFELFLDKKLYNTCVLEKERVNELLLPLFKQPVFTEMTNVFEFENIHPSYIVNNFEGQIDTGSMMASLLALVQHRGIRVLNSCEVTEYQSDADGVRVSLGSFEFRTAKLCITTNGFARQLLSADVKPARAQVLITEPIPDLHIEGTFHLDKGYYYFRNIDGRILFGGGRNLDFKAEETAEFGQTQLVQNKLEELLRTVILPGKKVKIAQRWSGIMGVGEQKKAIVKSLDAHVYCGVRLGGMGVAIGSLIGKELAEIV
ncbi:FAD-dependent oxidoreductase [Tenacibaculum litopenaei]